MRSSSTLSKAIRNTRTLQRCMRASESDRTSVIALWLNRLAKLSNTRETRESTDEEKLRIFSELYFLFLVRSLTYCWCATEFSYRPQNPSTHTHTHTYKTTKRNQKSFPIALAIV